MGLDLALYRALRSVDMPDDKAMAVIEALENHILAQRTAKAGHSQRLLDTKPGLAQPPLGITPGLVPTRLKTKSDVDALVSRFTINVSLKLVAFVLILIAAI